jgi:hypothetical protein
VGGNRSLISRPLSFSFKPFLAGKILSLHKTILSLTAFLPFGFLKQTKILSDKIPYVKSAIYHDRQSVKMITGYPSVIKNQAKNLLRVAGRAYKSGGLRAQAA